MSLGEYPAKFEDWDKIPNLTPIEAAYLWFGLEPQEWSDVLGPQRVKALATEIAAATNTRLPGSVRLRSFPTDTLTVNNDRRERASRQELISFAEGREERPPFLFPSERKNRKETPNSMLAQTGLRLDNSATLRQESVRDSALLKEQVASLTSERDEWKRKAEASRTEKSDLGENLNPRMKNNYLRVIMALAMDVKGFDPKKPYESATLIIEHTEIDLDQKTIAGYITEGYQLQSRNRS